MLHWSSDHSKLFEQAVCEDQCLQLEVQLQIALLQSDSTVVLLSVLSVLLSRLNGREDFLVLTSIDQTTLPLRLNPSWNLGFGELVEQVER